MNDLIAIEEREAGLASGRWGDSSQLLAHASDWYRHAGVDGNAVVSQRLHPIAHYQALLLHERDEDDLLASNAADARLPARGAAQDPKTWELTNAEPDLQLRAILEERLQPSCLVALTAYQRQQATDAAALLERTLPILGPDAMTYVGRFVLTDDSERVGETMRDLPTVMILGPVVFEDVKTLAESFFHEALHSKNILAERSANIPKSNDYERRAAIGIPWREEDNGATAQWSMCRSFMAFYVYVHLSVLWSALWERDREIQDLDRLRRSCFRAAYLSHQLHAHSDRTVLGAARWDILEWLDSLRLPAFDLTRQARNLLAS